MKSCALGLALTFCLYLPVSADEVHFAASSGNVEGLRKLIATDHRPVDGTDDNGVTPLMSAAESGQLAAVNYLISASARLDLLDKSGQTALHRAVKAGHVEVARSLLKAGAPVDARGADGVTPLLVTQGRNDYLPLIELLVEFKADLNLQSEDGSSVLYLAAYFPDPKVFSLLLEAGANPALRSDDCNALDALCLCLTDSAAEDVARSEVAGQLLQAGLKFDEPGLQDEIPLIVAAQRGNHGIVSIFLKHGADPNTKDQKGNPLLHNVASGSYLYSGKTVELVVNAGAKINALNTSGATALHMAAYNGNLAVAQALLGFPECDRGAKNSSGQTALELAQKRGFPKLAALLSR